MTHISKEEYCKRLAALKSGPWANALVKAQSELAPIDDLALPSTVDDSVNLDDMTLSKLNEKQNERLSIVLRSHYEDPDGITSSDEIEIRDALDDALTLPQLYELAIQTGYLSIDIVKEHFRKLLINLLWSPAARKYIDIYDYISVSMLAARLDIKWEGMARPIAPIDAALSYAGFLAHLRAFYDDLQIQEWISFLDDYIKEEKEQDKVWEYLQGKSETLPSRVDKLLYGCQLFVQSLSSSFSILNENDLGRFGLIHWYWLQKFFGYKATGSGYVKDIENWPDEDSWANTIMSSPHLVPDGIDINIAQIGKKQFCDQVKMLELTFMATKSLIDSTRANAQQVKNLTYYNIEFSSSLKTEEGSSNLEKAKVLCLVDE